MKSIVNHPARVTFAETSNLKNFVRLFALGAALFLPAFAAQAATETDASNGTSATTYDGTSLSNDLLLGAGVSSQYTVTTTNYNAGQSPVVGSNGYVSSGLNDGVLGSGNAGVTFFAGTGSNVDGTYPLAAAPQFTFALNTVLPMGSVTGYTLTNIQTIYGYAAYGQSLANQDYSVSFSTVAAPSVYIPLATVAYDPFSISNSAASSSLVTLSNLGAIGVANVRFTFTENANNTGAAQAGSVIRELIVNGSPTAVPEPATYALFIMGFGAVAFVARRRLTA